MLVLEFVASLDDAIIAELIKHRFGGLVSVAILECPHAHPSSRKFRNSVLRNGPMRAQHSELGALRPTPPKRANESAAF